MQVTDTTATSSAIQTTSNKTTTTGLSFEIVPNQTLDPLDISYQEYKKLSQEDIETIFGKSEKSSQASSLKSLTASTDDDTLNKIFFDDKLNDLKNGTEKSKNTFLAISLIGMPEMRYNIEHMDPDNLALTPEQMKEPFWQEILSKRDGIKTELKKPEIDVRDADDLINYFKDIRNYFDKEIDIKGSEHFYDEEEMFTQVESIVTRYEEKVSQNNALLASYTRTNTAPPVTSTTVEDILPSSNSEISPEDEKLFKSITEDNYVSYDEIKDLSYEQIVQIKDYVMKKDEQNNFIQSSFMDHDKKAGMLLGTTAISNNDTFNKAIFNIARKIDEEKLFNTFMYDMTGTQFSDKLMAYPEFQGIDYTHQDPKEYLSKKMASYQIKLDTAIDEESKEFYQEMINRFQGLTNHYKSLQGESIHDNNADPFEKLRALVEDLISVIKTGFTVEELENIEKLLAEIRKLLKDREDKDSATSNEDIDKQIKAIEDALLALEKRIHGVVIVEMEGETTKQQESNNSDETPSDGFHFKERLNEIEKRISSMKNGDLKLPTDTSSNDDEEKTGEEKEW